MNHFYICLPVHNGGSYLEKCVISILNQDYQNFHLLIFENCSSDGSLSFLSELEDNRISVFRSERFLNINDNWNRINSFFNSNVFRDNDFISLIGHDDYYKCTFLSTINNLINLNSDASIYNTHFDLVDKFDNLIRPCKPIPSSILYENFFTLRCWNHLDIYGTGYAFRVSDFIKVGGINVSFPLLLFSDDLMFLKLTKLSKMITSNSNEYCYRLHSSTSNSNSFLKVSNFLSALNMYVNEIRNANVINFNQENSEYLYFSVKYMIYRYINLYESILYYFVYKGKILSQNRSLNIEYLSFNDKKYFNRLIYGGNLLFFNIKVVICFLRNLLKY